MVRSNFDSFTPEILTSFDIAVTGSSLVSRYLCGLDSAYGQLFGVDSWQQHCERAASLDPADILEVTNRIQIYLHTAGPCTQIPIAEAMVNYKDEDSCQVFVPFISVSWRRSFNKIDGKVLIICQFFLLIGCENWVLRFSSIIIRLG